MDLETLRHSTSHVLAAAVKELYKDVKLGIGPAIEDGFYYDFERGEAFAPDDLAKIEQKMRSIIAKDYAFERSTMKTEDAARFFSEAGEKYKVELLKDIPDETVSLYTSGDFTDLCRGPHIDSTGAIKAFKLLSIAGAYWRGDEKNPMLQRIYGTVFNTAKELDEYLSLVEEAKKRDHRKLGKELGLFSFQEEWGPGLSFWHPKGAMVRKVIEDFWRDQHMKNGYSFVYTPHIGREELWQKSGHRDFYSEYMYSPMDVEKDKYLIKPMNCPGHILIYKSQTRSYRDLPIRFAELGTVYRYEKSGVLHGLMRVRGFTQDDAHIFCTPETLEEEIVGTLDLAFGILGSFGFTEYDMYVSTMPEKHVGDLSLWETSTEALKSALKKKNVRFEIDPGEGVFYGPKIDLKIKDALGRSWQCSTIQVDFNLPDRFEIEYAANDGSMRRPIMIHRALFGSLERFLGVLIEHYAGMFPVWLAPTQAVVIPVSGKALEYAFSVKKKLEEG
ncbi:MAG: threonine--tRNA ligase, partial [Candidatus Omnitrophota bacterium]